MEKNNHSQALFYRYIALAATQNSGSALGIEIAKTTLNLYIGFFFKPSSAGIVVGRRQDELQLILALSALVLFIITRQTILQKARLG